MANAKKTITLQNLLDDHDFSGHNNLARFAFSIIRKDPSLIDNEDDALPKGIVQASAENKVKAVEKYISENVGGTDHADEILGLTEILLAPAPTIKAKTKTATLPKKKKMNLTSLRAKALKLVIAQTALSMAELEKKSGWTRIQIISEGIGGSKIHEQIKFRMSTIRSMQSRFVAFGGRNQKSFQWRSC